MPEGDRPTITQSGQRFRFYWKGFDWECDKKGLEWAIAVIALKGSLAMKLVTLGQLRGNPLQQRYWLENNQRAKFQQKPSTLKFAPVPKSNSVTPSPEEIETMAQLEIDW